MIVANGKRSYYHNSFSRHNINTLARQYVRPSELNFATTYRSVDACLLASGQSYTGDNTARRKGIHAYANSIKWVVWGWSMYEYIYTKRWNNKLKHAATNWSEGIIPAIIYQHHHLTGSQTHTLTLLSQVIHSHNHWQHTVHHYVCFLCSGLMFNVWDLYR